MTKVFVVEVEDDEDAREKAIDFVMDELSGIDVSIPDNDIRELTTEKDLKEAQLFASEVCSL